MEIQTNSAMGRGSNSTTFTTQHINSRIKYTFNRNILRYCVFCLLQKCSAKKSGRTYIFCLTFSNMLDVQGKGGQWREWGRGAKLMSFVNGLNL